MDSSDYHERTFDHDHSTGIDADLDADYHERIDDSLIDELKPDDEPDLGDPALFDGPKVVLYDAHCHLGFTKDPERIARDAAALGIGGLCCTVTPTEYLALQTQLDECPNFQLAVGLHPWWVGEDPAHAAQLIELLPQTRYIGEVGLDFSPRFEGTDEVQLSVLETILKAAAEQGEKTISLHCVRAYEEMLGLLDSTDVAETCQCIFHWFSGSAEQLQRAIKLGCSFSVGPRMLQTKRGRALVEQIPRDRLLLETDAPWVDALDPAFHPVDFDVNEWARMLTEASLLVG